VQNVATRYLRFTTHDLRFKILKGKSYFGYKVLLFVTCAGLLAHVAASGYRGPFDDGDDPAPTPDSPVVAPSPRGTDSSAFLLKTAWATLPPILPAQVSTWPIHPISAKV